MHVDRISRIHCSRRFFHIERKLFSDCFVVRLDRRKLRRANRIDLHRVTKCIYNVYGCRSKLCRNGCSRECIIDRNQRHDPNLHAYRFTALRKCGRIVHTDSYLQSCSHILCLDRLAVFNQDWSDLCGDPICDIHLHRVGSDGTRSRTCSVRHGRGGSHRYAGVHAECISGCGAGWRLFHIDGQMHSCRDVVYVEWNRFWILDCHWSCIANGTHHVHRGWHQYAG